MGWLFILSLIFHGIAMNFVILMVTATWYFLVSARLDIKFVGNKESFEEKCGRGWLSEYLHMHQKMEANTTASRYLYFYPPPTGISDKLFAFVTAFYLAVLSKRALKVANTEYGRIMMDSFDNGPIELRTNYSSDDYFRCWDDGILSPKLNQTLQDIFGAKNSTIEYMSNRGNTMKLFNTVPFANVLTGFGINKRYAIYCAFEFLLQPKPEVIALANVYADKLLADPTTLKIGIHIRTGDETIRNQKLQEPLEKYMSAFECAVKLELEHSKNRSNSSSVKWLVLSDSLEIRRAAVEKYGDKIITDTMNPARHSSYGGSANHQIVSEILALTLCDYFVLDDTSGVGKLGSWLSHHRDNDNVYDRQRCQVLSDSQQAESNQGI